MTSPIRIKLHAQLAQAAIRDGWAREYRLWAFARALDTDGQGWVWLDDLARAWPQSRRTVERLLNRGNGLFFRREGRFVGLVGLEKVCIALGTPPGRAATVPADDIIELQGFKALCLSALFNRDGGVTISRRTLTEGYGVARQTLRNWEKKAGIERETNVARIASFDTGEEALAFCFSNASVGDGAYVYGGTVWRQMPNTYSAPWNSEMRDAAPARKTARRVREALCSDGVPPRPVRRYFEDWASASRAVNRGRTADRFYVRGRGETLGRSWVWDQCIS